MRPGGGGRSAVTSPASFALPQPDSPTSPSVSPRLMSRSTPSTALTASPPNPPMGKCLYAPLMRTRTGSARTAVSGARSAACIALHLRCGCLQLFGRLLRQRARLRRLHPLVRDVSHQDPAPSDLVQRDLAQARLRLDL